VEYDAGCFEGCVVQHECKILHYLPLLNEMVSHILLWVCLLIHIILRDYQLSLFATNCFPFVDVHVPFFLFRHRQVVIVSSFFLRIAYQMQVLWDLVHALC